MYQWIFVCGLLFAFYNAWGIGANDCANSFATSVGAKVLTLKNAVIIASIFEFCGAVLMGSHVTDMVRKKIVERDIFEGCGKNIPFKNDNDNNNISSNCC
jgi:phosphate/sulfate permease